jgi:hypothetical protein
MGELLTSVDQQQQQKLDLLFNVSFSEPLAVKDSTHASFFVEHG